MSINKMLRNVVEYIAEGFARIFSPAKDEYSDIGVQPFECEPYQETAK
ncbi:MAG TPA: isochorismate synthase [Cyanothece sp. UBA12306]|nr:isochorismate synthase [Cyanothece sp. UBA12306]